MINLRFIVVKNIAPVWHEHFGSQPGLTQQLVLIELSRTVFLDRNLANCLKRK
ncbi:hypothetical protein D3C76_1494380 [compost metagenome]